MADGRRRGQDGGPAARVLGHHADRERTQERLESETFDLLLTWVAAASSPPTPGT
jgi:hypothetical protein